MKAPLSYLVLQCWSHNYTIKDIQLSATVIITYNLQVMIKMCVINMRLSL